MSEKSQILVVDDEQGPRESLRMILSPEYDVATAHDGAEALELLRTTRVDLVTLDLNMPGMRGEEVMRTIRAEFPDVGIIIITGYGTLENAVDGLRSGVADYLCKPFDVVHVTTAVARALAHRTGHRHLIEFLRGIARVVGSDGDADDVLRLIGRSPETRARLEILLDRSAHDAAASSRDLRALEFLEVLAETIESRDAALRGHSRNVAFLCGLLADRLCLSAAARERLRLAAFLHDLGKVGLPSTLAVSDRGLDSEGQLRFAEHAAIGERLVRPLGFCSEVASTIRHHHERFDGAGSPDGLAGDAIPLAARIIAVADAFDAMTSNRLGCASLSPRNAVDELRKSAGSQLDPNLVEDFISIVETGACDLGMEDGPASVALGPARSSESAAPLAARQGGE